MAKISSPILSSASGSVGGAAFSTTNGRMRIQTRRKPTARNLGLALLDGFGQSGEVSYNKAGFTSNAQAWATLTDTQRAGWGQLAAQIGSGKPNTKQKNLTGINLFQAYNWAFNAGSGYFIADPPPPPMAAPLLHLGEWTWYAGDGNFANYATAPLLGDPPIGSLVMFATLPLSPGVTRAPRSNYSIQGAYYDPGANQVVISWNYNFPTYLPTFGSRVFVKLFQQDPNNWYVGEQLFNLLPSL